MGKLLPATLALSGLLGGLAAGYAMRPDIPDCGSMDKVENPGVSQEEILGSALERSGAAAPSAQSESSQSDCADLSAAPAGEARGTAQEGSGLLAASEFAKLPTQFVIPVLDEGRMRALVVLSVSLEVVPGTQEAVFSLEPKLRDGFLKVMFRHANSGGFDGNFTDRRAMEDLRGSLFQAAKALLGDRLVGVLILDIVRQDVG